ncbi:MAG TPA: hypothetical protein VGK22_05300 [Candidatus Angelobacter sp.]
MKTIVCILLLFFASTALAQTPTPTPNPTPSPSPTPPSAKDFDPATEMGQFKKSCSFSSPFKSPIGCLQVLFTGQPVHIAVGSIAPQNGFAAGAAFVGGHNTVSGNWRNTWNADAVVSPNLSWRTGVYLKFVDSRVKPVGIQKGTKGISTDNPTGIDEQPVINVYAQTITLNKLMFFGQGPDSTLSGRSFFGMRESIVGASVIKPLNDHKVNASVYAELNGRWVDIRTPSDSSLLPTTQSFYTEASAPGLTTQPFFLQLGVGARMAPDWKRLHLDYDLSFRPYLAPADARFTFTRLTADLQHEFQLYGKGFPTARTTNGPDDCSGDQPPKDPITGEVPSRVKTCDTQFSRNKVGTLSLRAFSSLSMMQGSSGVPFYFQPTLGGGDINGNSSLGAYTDYRFRAPNVLLIREAFEHTLGKWPLGLLLSADQGKVALLRSDLGSNPWIHTYAAGFTVRAGGLPVFSLQFAWGHEGTHILANVSNTLLGGSSRPSLF